MSSASAPLIEDEIIPHAIETICQSAWHQAAHVLSKLALPDRDLDHVDSLLEKRRNAEITDSERAELERYLRVGNFLDLMRARALRELGQTPA